MQNAKQYLFIISVSLLIGFGVSYALTNKTIEQQLEEQNTAILQDCLSKARVKTLPSEILEYASYCNKDLLKTISTPRSVETITGTHSTGNTVPPLGFQLIPQAKAESVPVQTSDAVKNVKTFTGGHIRTPKQIYEQVKHLGYREAPTISLISTCKASSQHVQKCILVGLVLMYNEAGNQQKSKACIERNNCFGIKSGKAVYSSLNEGMENFVQKYNKYWYKAESAGFFYSSAGKVSKSRYCTSESSSNTEIGCPRGLLIASKKWDQLKGIIYLK